MSNKPKVNKSGNKRGLSRKGSKNLKKENGKLINDFGVEFTAEEQKKLNYKVNSAMAKRKKLLTEKNNEYRTIFGVKQDYKVGDDFSSNDFIMAKKSKSLNQFKTRKQYETYMKNLERVTDRNYINNRVEAYKQNYIKSINLTFGSDGTQAIEKLKNMKVKDFAKLMNTELYSGIQYIYSNEEYNLRLEGLNAVLGVD